MQSLLYLLFFFSGASGLIYQVVWVREFGNVFGNTIYSASLVIAVFMSGLGVGSYVTGVWADRRYSSTPSSLLTAYGYCELAIGGGAFLVSAILPHLGTLSATLSHYTQDADGWYSLSTPSYLARYVIAVLLLAPITTVMGGTLTLLIRHLVRENLDAAGWKIGALYGVNTAGAAAGCFLTDYAFIPTIGLYATQLVSVLLNFVAAFGALRLAARGSRSETIEPTASARLKPSPGVDSAGSPSVVVLMGIAMFLSGFAAMGIEIVWFRHVVSMVGSIRTVFSVLLSVILIGIWLGALAGGWIARHLGRSVMFYMITQALFILSTLYGLTTADSRQIHTAAGELWMPFLSSSGSKRAVIELWFNLRPVLHEVAAPALFMGAAFPLANAAIQHAEGAVGRRAGVLYFANTIGAVLGAVTAGFVLLPHLGMQHSTTLLLIFAMMVTIPLYATVRLMPARAVALRSFTAVFVAVLITTGAALTFWVRLPTDYVTARVALPPNLRERTITVSEGITELLAITQTPHGDRRLFTNGFPMSANGVPAGRQMRPFAHIPLLSLDAPERAVVICFGVGNTAHAVSLHPSIRRLEVVDLSRQILHHARYFAASNGEILKHPKAVVYVNDGRHHLRLQREGTYDLITLEPPPIAQAGVSALYAREFYELARTRLKPQGYMTQWLPVYQVPAETTLALIRAFVDVFPHSVLLSTMAAELMLMGVNDSHLELDPDRVEANLRLRPAVQRDLDVANLGTLTTIVGTFVASASTLSRITQLYVPVTDDLPSPEYAVKSRLEHHRIPGELFDVATVAEWCPKCFSEGKPRVGLEDLGPYLAFLQTIYQNPKFLEYNSVVPAVSRAPHVRVMPGAEKVFAANPYLQHVVGFVR